MTTTKKSAPLPPREERLRHQGKMLDEIMRHKRDEVPKRAAMMPLASLRALAETAPAPLDFAAALRRPGVSLIAEVKKASPSRGLLCRDFDPARLAQVYAQGGAAAISVLTDARFFQGHLEHLTTVKNTVTQSPSHPVTPPPVLRKDFIYDPYQIVEARVAGADALLLIVAVLGDNELKRLLAQTRSYGMEALVEVHDEDEVARALKAGARVIGVNNRDLRTFAVDIAVTARRVRAGQRERHPHPGRRAPPEGDGRGCHAGGRKPGDGQARRSAGQGAGVGAGRITATEKREPQRRINGSHSRTGVALAVGVAVALGVRVGVHVPVGVAVAVGVGLGVEVAVAVAVGVAVGVAVAVAVGVGVAVAVGLAVGVDVRVGVGCPAPLATTSVYSLLTVFGW